MSKSKFYDFSHCKVGTRVVRSAAWRGPRREGLLVGKEFHPDAANPEGDDICWPVIHWEGKESAYAMHPSNASPAPPRRWWRR
jgi:hypothetical protein